MHEKDICVIANPTAGRNRAGARLRHLQRRLQQRADFRLTERPGHGEDLALQAADEGFRVVAAAGGDGTVHEVATGLLRAGRPEVAFGVFPLGSANDYVYSLERQSKAGGDAESANARRVDVGVVQDASGQRRYFVNSLGLGLNGAVTLEARTIRNLQGIALYGLATLRALWYRYACPRMTLEVDGKTWETPTLMISVGLGQKEGGFVLAPQARLDDGLFEMLHAGDLSRWEVLRFLPRLALAGPPTDHPKISIRQCRHIKLRSERPLTIHIDGEFFCRPEDQLQEVEIQILPGALQVVSVANIHGASG
jgi:YegS/Rv2252/BmrU family lipid kinase